MIEWRHLALVAVGGALGSAARYLVNVGVGALLGPRYPWWTIVANVSGCLAMGVLAGVLATRSDGSGDIRIFLATGVLGGYTTFSAFSLDFAGLLGRGEIAGAAIYLVLSVAGSLGAVLLGLWLARAWI